MGAKRGYLAEGLGTQVDDYYYVSDRYHQKPVRLQAIITSSEKRL